MMTRETHMKLTVRFQLTLKSTIANMYTNRKSQALVRMWGVNEK